MDSQAASAVPIEKPEPREYAFYQHAHTIPLVGVVKEKRTLIGPW